MKDRAECPKCRGDVHEGSRGFFWCICGYTHYAEDYQKEPRDYNLLKEVFRAGQGQGAGAKRLYTSDG